MGGLFSKNHRQSPRPPPPALTQAAPPPPPPPPPQQQQQWPSLTPPQRPTHQPSISLPPPPPPPQPPQPAAFPFPHHPPPPPSGYSYSYAQPSYSYAPPNPYGSQPPGPYSYQYGCQPQPHYSQYVGGGGGWGHGPGAGSGPVAAPGMSAVAPAFVDHKTAKKVKNDVNVHKDTIRVFVDEENKDYHLVSFTFDALVDGSITIYYFAKEGANCTFSSVFPEVYKPRRIPFQKGSGQKFCQPSGSGFDLGFFETDELSKPSPGEDVFPLVICAETGTLPPLMDDQTNQPSRPSSSHAQITQAVLEKNSEGEFKVRVVRQLLWIDEVRYELREIYGISNADEGGFEDSDPGKECIICMTEPKNTAVLPCRHMCMCSECARELRLQSNKCPICRQPIEELIEIKVNNAAT